MYISVVCSAVRICHFVGTFKKFNEVLFWTQMINIHSAKFVTLMAILKNFHGEPYLDIISVFLDTLQVRESAN